jgi:hypothetical protein
MFPILPTSRYHHLLVVLVDPPLNYTRLNGPGPPDVTAVLTKPIHLLSRLTPNTAVTTPMSQPRCHKHQEPPPLRRIMLGLVDPEGSHLLGRPNQDLAVLLRRGEDLVVEYLAALLHARRPSTPPE